MEPICFVTVPDYRIPEIKIEIQEKDANMLGKNRVIGYSQIRDFIKKYMHDIPHDYEYGKYIEV